MFFDLERTGFPHKVVKIPFENFQVSVDYGTVKCLDSSPLVYSFVKQFNNYLTQKPSSPDFRNVVLPFPLLISHLRYGKLLETICGYCKNCVSVSVKISARQLPLVARICLKQIPYYGASRNCGSLELVSVSGMAPASRRLLEDHSSLAIVKRKLEIDIRKKIMGSLVETI